MVAAKERSGKPVFAFADESAYSAAYAMACIADEIYLPKEGGVGSVGVIGVLEDWTKFNERMGIQVAVVTSGAHKADGHPDVALREDVVSRYQQRINSLAQSFAEVVASARGMTPDAVLALQAGCFYGEDAVAKGLANGVKSFDDVVAIANARSAVTQTRATLASSPAIRRPIMTMKAAPAGALQGEAILAGEFVQTHAEFALAAGLPHDAAKGDILAEMSRKNARLSALVAALGAKNEDEAIGVAAAFKETTAEVTKLRAEAAANAKRLEADEAEKLIAAAIAGGKVPSNGEKARGIYTEYGLGALKAHLDALVPQPALAGRAPGAPEQKQHQSDASGKEADVTLSPEDEKMIRTQGIDRADFIAQRQEEARRRRGRRQ